MEKTMGNEMQDAYPSLIRRFQLPNPQITDPMTVI